MLKMYSIDCAAPSYTFKNDDNEMTLNSFDHYTFK